MSSEVPEIVSLSVNKKKAREEAADVRVELNGAPAGDDKTKMRHIVPMKKSRE